LLLQAALHCDVDIARAAWDAARSHLDLDGPVPDDDDLLPLVARRLARLSPDDPLRPRLAGLHRKVWYLNQLVLSRATGAGGGHALALAGRAASAAAYFPDAGVQAVRQIEHAPRGAETMVVTWGRRDVAVVAPADHLLDALARRHWPDAVYSARHPAMDWERFAALRRRVPRRTLRHAVAILDEVAGQGLAPPGARTADGTGR
jgi:hypothetical protein